MDMTKLTEKDKKAVQNYFDFLLTLTFRICHWDKDGNLQGRSSGFLYQKNEDSPMLVITAGHKTPPHGSFIETKHVYENSTAAINAGNFEVFYQHEQIDYAYSILPIDLIKRDIEANMQFEFIVYKEAFDKAIKDEAYGFAVRNNYEFVKTPTGLIAPTYLCCEAFMELEKQTEHINYFKTSRPIQEHEYYRGASGSPITDPTGRINSILIGGTEPKKLLKGFRLDNMELP